MAASHRNFTQIAGLRKLYLEMLSSEELEGQIKRLKERFVWSCAVAGLYLAVVLKLFRGVDRYNKAIWLRSLRAIENLTRQDT
jgi:hypothetical protein